MIGNRQWVSEEDFIKQFELPDVHCGSCHADAADGYYGDQMIIVEWHDKWSDVCCEVRLAYERKIKEIPTKG